MQASASSKPEKCSSGVSLNEYAILLGLIGVVGIAGLKALGMSTSNLFQGSSNTLASHSTLSLLDIKPQGNQGGLNAGNSANTGPLPGKGYYSISTASGQPVLQLVDGAQGAATNVSSIDGSKMTTLGTVMIAKSLDQLAATETDPVLQNYYAQMAKLSYYLGGAEGELDDVAGLQGYYDNADALRDVLVYKDQLQKLMSNPPAGADAAAVLPLTADVYNIAQRYANALSKYVRPDGSIQNFYDGQNTSKGSPGDVLKNIALTSAKPEIPVGKSYDQIISYDQMKALANEVLADQKVASAPVVSTLTDASQVNTIAESGVPATDTTTSTNTKTKGCGSASKGSTQ